jgi:hypothetical protein
MDVGQAQFLTESVSAVANLALNAASRFGVELEDTFPAIDPQSFVESGDAIRCIRSWQKPRVEGRVRSAWFHWK